MSEHTPKRKEKVKGEATHVKKGKTPEAVPATSESGKGRPITAKNKKHKLKKVGKVADNKSCHQRNKDSKEAEPVVLTVSTNKRKTKETAVNDRKRTRDSSSSSYSSSSEEEEEEKKYGSITKKRKVLQAKPKIDGGEQKPKSRP